MDADHLLGGKRLPGHMRGGHLRRDRLLYKLPSERAGELRKRARLRIPRSFIDGTGLPGRLMRGAERLRRRVRFTSLKECYSHHADCGLPARD
jgi:hypothetical protein